MKANEAPEKLYFGEGDKGIFDIYSTKESDDEIEYIRTDAFIEKAARWLSDNTLSGIYLDLGNTKIVKEFIDNIKKYIKVE